MIKEVIVQNRSGLHAGIAGALYQIAKEQQVHAFIRYGRKTTSIKEFLKVLALGVKSQDKITLIVDGDNEETATMMMVAILENGGV